MEVSVKELNHPAFIGALSKLDNCAKYPTAQMSFNVMKIVKQCHEAIKDQRELYKKLVKEYAQLDEAGEIKLTDNKEIVYKDAAAEAEHQAKFEEFMNAKLKITGEKLPLSALDNAQIAPIEFEAIMCLIDQASV